MMDGVRLEEAPLSSQESPSAGSIHHPVRRHAKLLALRNESYLMRTDIGEGDRNICGRRAKIKIRMGTVKSQQFAFELVAVQLIGCNIRERTNVRLAVVFKAGVPKPGGLPIESQIVFQIMLA